MEANDYRLERWLAILLSLLFFLPFVARADDILYTGSFHGDEMRYRDGEAFLTFAEDVLVPVAIDVEIEEDPILDEEGEKTGKRVAVPGLEDAHLIRGKNLHPGKITLAQPNFAELHPSARKATFVLGSRTYQMSYRCGESECTLVLTDGELSQDLIAMPIDRHGDEIINISEVDHFINFAGDLDHDGRLDLIAHLSRGYNETRPTLWLSSAAKDGELLRMTAELSTTGC